MDLGKETIDRILELAPTGRTQIHGLEYQDLADGFRLVGPPSPPATSVTTLDGLVNLLEAGYNAHERKPADLFIHVLDWQQVHVVPKCANSYGAQPALGKEMRPVKGRVKLAPFRTFRELKQPESEFVFRVHPGGTCSLNEADGGAWKIAAVNAIADWLANRLKTSAVEGIGDIPIIS
jgi:hypothetical protein